MLNQSLYESIFHRKSIRKYNLDNKNINLEKIKEFLSNAERLNDSKVEFKIITKEYLNTHYMKPATYYIAAFSEDSISGLNNIGFILEQLDLYFSQNNIGTCWEGIPSAKDKLKELSELNFKIVLAFGKTKENIHRTKISEFNRKPIEEIGFFNNINMTNSIKRIIEGLQFAPSARNSQPWYIYFNDENSIDFYSKKPSFIDKRIGMDMYNQIDIGIGLLCLCLGIKKENKNYTINYNNELKDFLKDYKYTCNIKIE
jgi:hypothetical protein